MRLFIAINFDEDTLQNILAVQQRLRQYGTGNFSRPGNLHLTLAFLGEVAPSGVSAVCTAMDNTSVQPMTLMFDHADCFKRDGGDIWWLGLKENAALLSLQRELSEHLAKAGFRLENRRFSPHVTLAREGQLVVQPDSRALLEKPIIAKTSAISLMRSERIGGRLTYTEQYCRR